METIRYGNKEIPVTEPYDTVVVGGGTAGAAAAISSAKEGNRTLIIEKMNGLGGTQVHGLVMPMMPSSVEHGAIFKEIEAKLEERIRTGDGYSKSVWFSPEEMANCLETLYLGFGGEILYDACLTDAVVEKEEIQYLVAMTPAGLYGIRGSCYIDASGDAVLARMCGVPCESGDEAGRNQVSSLRFEVGGIQIEAYRSYCREIGDTFCPMLEEGEYFESAMVGGRGFPLELLFQKGVQEGILKPEDLRYYQCFTIPGKRGSMSFNCPHIASLQRNTDPLERSRGISEGHRMIRRLVAFLKCYMPGFAEAYLQKEAVMLGVRESFRIRGQYILTEEDYLNRAKFEDGVVKGDWYIDVHSSDQGLVHKSKYEPGEYYEIPYRSLVTHEIKNIMVIGRCISATFLMQASIRIQPTLIDMGELAGKACSYARKEKQMLNQIDGRLLKQLV